MKRYGVDSAHSWILVLVGTFVTITIGGSFIGSSGVLYKIFIDYNNATKEEASWPSSVHAGMAILAGPVTAVLSTRLSVRGVTTLGVLLYAIGHCICFFSTNLVFICLFYGGLSGIGKYIGSITVPALVTRIFEKNRVTAMGLIMLGLPIGSLIYPFITKALLENYGLNGTFLLLGAVNLHGILGSVLLKEVDSKIDDVKKCTINDRMLNKVSDSVTAPPVSTVELEGVYRALAQEVSQCASSLEMKNSGTTKFQFSFRKKSGEKYHLLSETISETVSDVQRQDKVETTESTFQRFIKLLKLRGFHLANVTQCISFLLGFFYVLVIIDYGTNKNLSSSKSFSLLSIYSVGMFLGRFAIGWISDMNLLPKTVYMFIAYGILAALCFAVPVVYQYEYLMLISVLCGTLLGSLMPISYVLFADYLCKEDVILGMSISRSCAGVISLLRPLMIGIFSGKSDTYDELFIFMGTLASLTSILMLAEFVWNKWQINKETT